MEPKFKTTKELLDFVLTECGDMKYMYKGEEYAHTESLSIFQNFNMERIYYAL